VLPQGLDDDLGQGYVADAACCLRGLEPDAAGLSLRLLEAERVEAALVEASAGAIAPRADMDPRAFLGVDGEPLTER
jgi:hypothetical protein